MSPAPTARAPPSPSCARFWKPPASACTSTPRRIWCASTSASGSAAGRRRLVADAELADALAECERANGDAPITVFEIETAAALLLFARHPADMLLLEVGLGGRLDATNVIEHPLATVITPISIDHVDFLGDTSRRSRREGRHLQARRAGADRAAAARGAAVLERAGRRSRAPLKIAGAALDGDRGTRPPGLSGRARPARSAGAAAVRPPSVRQCRHRHRGAARVPDPRCRRGAYRGRAWPRPIGRRGCSGCRTATLVALAPPGSELWLDGGHNPDGGRAVAAALADLEERVSRPLVLIVGMLSTKDSEGFLRNFAGLARRVIRGADPARRRALPAEMIADVARARRHSGRRAESIEQALARDRRARPRSAAAHPHHRLALSCGRGAGANGTLPV